MASRKVGERKAGGLRTEKVKEKLTYGVRWDANGLAYFSRQFPLDPAAYIPFDFKGRTYTSLHHMLLDYKLALLNLPAERAALQKDSRPQRLKDMESCLAITVPTWIRWKKELWNRLNEGVAAQYEQSPLFAETLWSVGNRHLVYSSTTDLFLGGGHCVDHPNTLLHFHARGSNEHGWALKQLRREKAAERAANGMAPDDQHCPLVPNHLVVTTTRFPPSWLPNRNAPAKAKPTTKDGWTIVVPRKARPAWQGAATSNSFDVLAKIAEGDDQHQQPMLL